MHSICISLALTPRLFNETFVEKIDPLHKNEL